MILSNHLTSPTSNFLIYTMKRGEEREERGRDGEGEETLSRQFVNRAKCAKYLLRPSQ